MTPDDAGDCCGRPPAWAPLPVFVEVGLRLVKPDVIDHPPPVVADQVLGIDRDHAVPVYERLDAPGPDVLITALNVRQEFDDFGLKSWCAVQFPQGEQAVAVAGDEQVQQVADLLREGLFLVHVVERLL